MTMMTLVIIVTKIAIAIVLVDGEDGVDLQTLVKRVVEIVRQKLAVDLCGLILATADVLLVVN